VTVVGVLIFFSGFGKFGTKDGRTKTGYKDNVLPDIGGGCMSIIVGIFLVFMRIKWISEYGL
jgi:hypothetical protein